MRYKKAPPSFPFFTSDWLGSNAVEAMTPEQRGCYIQLLARCWQSEDCTLPADPEQLGRLSGAFDRWTTISGPVLACFSSVPEHKDRLTNPKLFGIRERQDEFRAKQASNAVSGWRNRARGGRSGIASAMPEGNGNGSICSSSLRGGVRGGGSPPADPAIDPSTDYTRRVKAMLALKDYPPDLVAFLAKPPTPEDLASWIRVGNTVGEAERARIVWGCNGRGKLWCTTWALENISQRKIDLNAPFPNRKQVEFRTSKELTP